MGVQQQMPGSAQAPAQASLVGKSQAEGKCCRLRQLRHQPPWQKPVVGVQAADAGTARVQHQPQRVVGGQQRQAIAAQLVPKCSGLHQSLAPVSYTHLTLPTKA